MKVGIMQPYFFPYIGYFQLLNAVDQYVIYDDVSFIKGGWINRNRILYEGGAKYFNVPMIGASSNKLISQIGVNTDIDILNQTLRTITKAYENAPYFTEVYDLIRRVLFCEKEDLASFSIESLKIVSEYLEIKTKLLISSSLKKDRQLHGQDRILDICNSLGATEYYNAIGGQNLYSAEVFDKRGVSLNFLQSNRIEYEQFSKPFQENLSIVDTLMFNSREEVMKMLIMYTII